MGHLMGVRQEEKDYLLTVDFLGPIHFLSLYVHLRLLLLLHRYRLPRHLLPLNYHFQDTFPDSIHPGVILEWLVQLIQVPQHQDPVMGPGTSRQATFHPFHPYVNQLLTYMRAYPDVCEK